MLAKQKQPRLLFGVSSLAILAMTGFSAADATAQDAARGGFTLDEVIVTAQKREQSLQDVSAAVSAVTVDRLQMAQINNLSDLQLIVPSITLGNDFNMAKLFVRGVGANTSTTGSETGVAVHVDGVVIARAEAQLTSLFDLDRVEVLRGPQGTLYGRNATGGSINMITAKPTDELEAYGQVKLGNYSALTTEGAISGPITDSIRARVAFKTEDRGGFGMNPVTGSDVDDLNRRMARMHLQFLASDSVDFLLTGEWFRQDDASGALKFWRESFIGVPRLVALGIGGYATNPRDLASEVDPHTDTETWSITGVANWRVNDSITISNIFNYRDFETSITQDLDSSAIVNSLTTTGAATTVQRRDVSSKQYSDELQFKYASDWLNGVLGFFYFHERQRPIDTVGLGAYYGMASNVGAIQTRPIIRDNAAPPNPALIGSIPLAEVYELCGIDPTAVQGVAAPKRVCIKSNLGTDAWAVFGQFVFNFGKLSESLDSFSLKLGGRYSHEKRDSANPAVIIAGGGAGPIVQNTTAATFREKTFKDFTPEAGFEWRPTDDVMVYYTYSEGFKAGAGENAAGSTIIVDPESILNHEAGLKSSWLDNRLAINLAAFTYKLHGLQINKTVGGGPAGFSTIFENAAETSADGVELEFFAAVTEGLRASGALSYIDSQFDDFLTQDPLDPRNVSSGTPAGNPATDFIPPSGAPAIQLAGNPTRNSPKWAWNFHAEWDIPGLGMPGDGALTLSGDVSHKSAIYFTEFFRLLEGSRAYTMFDAALSYTSGDERITASIWGKNLSNAFRPTSTFALSTARTLGVTYLPPRTYGFSVGYRF